MKVKLFASIGRQPLTSRVMLICEYEALANIRPGSILNIKTDFDDTKLGELIVTNMKLLTTSKELEAAEQPE